MRKEITSGLGPGEWLASCLGALRHHLKLVEGMEGVGSNFLRFQDGAQDSSAWHFQSSMAHSPCTFSTSFTHSHCCYASTWLNYLQLIPQTCALSPFHAFSGAIYGTPVPGVLTLHLPPVSLANLLILYILPDPSMTASSRPVGYLPWIPRPWLTLCASLFTALSPQP